ncbi:MAG TPA: hypothetical protein VMV69_02905 [Pirellulales bacterium]|nr:hypothetical protein [Pirellulales bacterium]
MSQFRPREVYKHRVRACYVPFPADPLSVFVISQKARYDLDLSDPVADLEMDLFQRNWPVEVLQLPAGSPESSLSFFNPVNCIQVYGDAWRATVGR